MTLAITRTDGGHDGNGEKSREKSVQSKMLKVIVEHSDRHLICIL